MWMAPLPKSQAIRVQTKEIGPLNVTFQKRILIRKIFSIYYLMKMTVLFVKMPDINIFCHHRKSCHISKIYQESPLQKLFFTTTTPLYIPVE